MTPTRTYATARRRVFGAEHLRHLDAVFGEVCEDCEAQLMKFNGETDHVHLHINYPPKLAVYNPVNSLKGVSARIMRRDHPDLGRRFWHDHLWSPFYFAGSSGGAPLSELHHYIENQQRPDEATPRTPTPPRPEQQSISAKALR